MWKCVSDFVNFCHFFQKNKKQVEEAITTDDGSRHGDDESDDGFEPWASRDFVKVIL